MFVPRTSQRKTFLIAEIGSNHDGQFEQALRLMDIAAEAGADAVKFQSFLADHLVLPGTAEHALLKRIEMPRDWYQRLQAEATQRGLIFFSTATNDVTLGWLEECGAAMYKIASPNLTHLPLIRKTAALQKPLVMSTGMATLQQIDEAVQTALATGNDKICLLHCVSEYPAQPASINLRFIESLRALYPFPIGFSDHTLEIGTAVAAVALGAVVVEKHLTLDRSLAGPDHHYALQPEEFIMMARNIRTVEAALGSPFKILTAGEREKSTRYWRSLHCRGDLPAGAVLTAEHVDVVRPNDGLHPRHLDDVLGMVLRHPLRAGQPITWDAFKDDDLR